MFNFEQTRQRLTAKIHAHSSGEETMGQPKLVEADLSAPENTAVISLFRESVFDSEITQAMGIAYDKLCEDIGLSQCDDELNTRVAKIIIMVARTGERDPDRMCAGAVTLLLGLGDHQL
jgi:hypothetical protein